MVIYTYLGKHLNIYWIKTFVQVFVVPMMNPNDFDVFFLFFLWTDKMCLLLKLN